VSEARTKDRRDLLELDREVMLDLFFNHIRNLWRVDGLYFLEIEKKYKTDAALAMDIEVHTTLAKMEAKELPKLLGVSGRAIPDLMKVLRHSSWALDQQDKVIEVEPDRAIFRVTACGTQLTRQKKGFGIFPCRAVREGYLNAFVETFNQDLQVICRRCPPDPCSGGTWCEWEFTRRSK
jgi:hypothetical protein